MLDAGLGARKPDSKASDDAQSQKELHNTCRVFSEPDARSCRVLKVWSLLQDTTSFPDEYGTAS